MLLYEKLFDKDQRRKQVLHPPLQLQIQPPVKTRQLVH